jgi:hypothetical protein
MKTYTIYGSMENGYFHENLEEFTGNKNETWLGSLSETKKVWKKLFNNSNYQIVLI